MSSGAEYSAGLDIGSTTMKMVVMRGADVVWKRYERHCANVEGLLAAYLAEAAAVAPGEVQLQVTGSVGMGVAEEWGLPFVQEVVAASHYMQERVPGAASMIDIGGEDAKVVILSGGRVEHLRMNGNCSGGTGAFIDQMAVLLGVSVEELGALAERSTQLYPLASRCGVFCKTDIQNLLARGAAKEDIAASVFHAIAVQTVTTLAHGAEIAAPVLLCGGPLCHLAALRRAFARYLKMDEERDFLLPADAHLLPAMGAALCRQGGGVRPAELRERLLGGGRAARRDAARLAPLFADAAEYSEWRAEHSRTTLRTAELRPGVQRAWLGIDSGSTTTKVALIDEDGALLYTYYRHNDGRPLGAVAEALAELTARCEQAGTHLHICGSCSTGYGEDLIRAAFHLDSGVVETMAHYMAAQYLLPEVSFILDIGGQDMKAVFVRDGVIHRIEINEACSSGCGSFISTFAQTLGMSLPQFTQAACRAAAPCDLGTRCTVFMNSRIKQVLRQGAGQEDIAAGLSYSVVRNCLYKVLRIKNMEELGRQIVVQGGAMLNDAVVRAFEQLAGVQVVRSERPELMGAFGCALYARQAAGAGGEPRLIAQAQSTTKRLHCGGCENRCEVTCYDFGGGRRHFSGNRCESVFTNSGAAANRGENIFKFKDDALFNRPCGVVNPRLRLGVPRCLGMYENYPFWHALFTACGIEVVLSPRSTQGLYENGAARVMSDNICFPAKLVHGHIRALQEQGVQRIFMPFVLHEKSDPAQHESFNCPIVSGYTEVVQSVHSEAPVDAPSVSFRDEELLWRQCVAYLATLGVPAAEAAEAVRTALRVRSEYEQSLRERNEQILSRALAEGRQVILLAGRPYHTDPLVQHKLSDMIAAMGIAVINEDIAREEGAAVPYGPYLPQWAYPNRILRAAQWVNEQPSAVQMVQMTSFGCGPDALLTDAVGGVLRRSGRQLTLLKIDDVNNTGSLKLRIRSLVESLRLHTGPTAPAAPPRRTPLFGEQERKQRTILAPFFSEYISPLVPAVFSRMGQRWEVLPPPDEESLEWGVKCCNNEMCYPAVLVVGDFIRAFRSGRYRPEECAVAITQTGGQCRASNYLPIIRQALLENGYEDTPVVALAPGSALGNEQPGFRLNWLRLIPLALDTLLFADCISRFYHAAAVREQTPGAARLLREKFLAAGDSAIRSGRRRALTRLIGTAAQAFAAICRPVRLPRVGVVGEIYLKFNPFAQRSVTQWLMDRGIEVVPPMLTPFFTQTLANLRARWDSLVEKRRLPNALLGWLERLVESRIDRANAAAAAAFPWFIPIEKASELATLGSRAVNLNAQFGEGWLLPAEVLSLAQQGVTHVVSLQPFGCIANHIVQKGIENKLRRLVPQLSLLSLDFDSSVSDVNITNRLLLFVDDLK